MTIGKVVEIKNEIYNLQKKLGYNKSIHRDNLENCDYFFDLNYILLSIGEDVLKVYGTDNSIQLGPIFGEALDGLCLGSHQHHMHMCLKRGEKVIFTSSCKFKVPPEEKATVDFFKELIDNAVVIIAKINKTH